MPRRPLPIDLKTEWLFLCAQLDAPGEWAKAYDKVTAPYQSTTRKYHDLDHLREGLYILGRVPDHQAPDNPAAFRFAWFGHDVEQELIPRQDEARSAAFMDFLARDLGLPRIAADTWKLILATRHHGPAQDHDTALICDMDLYHFGKPREDFLDDRLLVREEYWPLVERGIITPQQFSERSAAILERFTSRGKIFQTRWFRERFEDQARDNLEWYIRELRT